MNFAYPHGIRILFFFLWMAASGSRRCFQLTPLLLTIVRKMIKMMLGLRTPRLFHSVFRGRARFLASWSKPAIRRQNSENSMKQASREENSAKPTRGSQNPLEQACGNEHLAVHKPMGVKRGANWAGIWRGRVLAGFEPHPQSRILATAGKRSWKCQMKNIWRYRQVYHGTAENI